MTGVSKPVPLQYMCASSQTKSPSPKTNADLDNSSLSACGHDLGSLNWCMWILYVDAVLLCTHIITHNPWGWTDWSWKTRFQFSHTLTLNYSSTVQRVLARVPKTLCASSHSSWMSAIAHPLPVHPRLQSAALPEDRLLMTVWGSPGNQTHHLFVVGTSAIHQQCALQPVWHSTSDCSLGLRYLHMC